MNLVALDRDQVIEVMQQDLNVLAQFTMPEVFTLDFPPLYCELYTMLLASARTPRSFDQYALGLPRGFAKTTFLKLFVLGLIQFTPASFIYIAASNETKARRILADIKSLLLAPNVRQIFGDYTESAFADRADFLHFAIKTPQGTKSVIIACTGAKGDPRGAAVDFKRPDFILLDDAQSKECAKSSAESATFRDWMFATLLKSKSEKGCLTVYIGNLYAEEGCVLRELRDSSDWTSIIVGAILADGQSLWPELKSREELITEFRRDVRAGNAHIFISEVLNNDTMDALTGFDYRKIPAWKPQYDSAPPDGKFLIIDPSGRKRNSDDTAILYVESRDSVLWARMVLHGVFNPLETIKYAIALALHTETRLILCEDIAYQDSLRFWFEEQIKELGLIGVIEVAPINRGNMAKNAAILGMFKDIQARDVYGEPLIGVHPQVLPDFLAEVKKFDPSTTRNIDNILDVVTYMRPAYERYKQHILDPVGALSVYTPRLVARGST